MADNDIASIGIAVNTSQVNNANTVLATFAKTSNTVTEATLSMAAAQKAAVEAMIAGNNVSGQTIKAAGGMATVTALFTQALKDQKAASLETTAAVLSSEQSKAAAVTASAATVVAANERIKLSSLGVRELITIPRELLEGNLTRAIGSTSILAQQMGLLTIGTLGFLAIISPLIASVGLLATAFIKGELESNNLARSLVATNGYAGETASAFDDMAKRISASQDQGVRSVKAGLQELTSSGQFTASTIDLMTQAAVAQSKLTGESVDKIAKSYEGAGNGVVDFAAKHELSFHDITLAQLDYIASLEESGRRQDAEAAYFNDLATNLKSRVVPAMGFVQQAAHDVATAASNMWDRLLDIGRPETVEQKLGVVTAKLIDETKQVKELESGNNPATANLKAFNLNQLASSLRSTLAEQAPLLAEYNKQQADAAAKAKKEQEDSAAIQRKYGNNQPDKPKAAGPDYTTAAEELKKYNDQLETEVSLYGQVGDAYKASQAADKEIDSIEKKKDAKGHNIELNAAQKASILDVAESMIYQKNANDALNKSYADATDPLNNYLVRITAISDNLSHGNISQGQANAQTYKANTDFQSADNPVDKLVKDQENQLAALQALSPEKQADINANKIYADSYAKLNSITPETIADLDAQIDKYKQNAKVIEQATLLRNEENKIIEGGSIQAQKNLAIEIAATNQAYAAGKISLQDYQVQLTHIQQVQLELNANKSGNFVDIMKASLHSLVDTGKTVSQQLQQTFGSFFSNFQDGLNKSIVQGIFESKNFGQALQSVARTGVETLLESLLKIGEQQLLNAALGTTASDAATANAVAQGALIAAAYAPAATAVSIASFGAADAAAAAAMTSTYTLGSALATAAHFAGGGPISGPGGPTDDKIPVWASDGEYIVNAQATARNRPLLDAINNGGTSLNGKFANGGIVNHSNSSSNQTLVHYDFSGANFGGSVTKDDVAQILDQQMRTVYGPAIVKTSTASAVRSQAAINKHSKLNQR
jgi:hypothetical protein